MVISTVRGHQRGQVPSLMQPEPVTSLEKCRVGNRKGKFLYTGGIYYDDTEGKG